MQFSYDDKLTMKEFRTAETSNSAAMDLMAAHMLTPEGEPMSANEAMTALDSLTMVDFYAAWANFTRAQIPLASGRRS